MMPLMMPWEMKMMRRNRKNTLFLVFGILFSCDCKRGNDGDMDSVIAKVANASFTERKFLNDGTIHIRLLQHQIQNYNYSPFCELCLT